MKMYFKMFVSLCTCAAIMTGCGKEDDNKGKTPDPGQEKKDLTGVTVTKITGDIKMGQAIVLKGEGFDDFLDAMMAVSATNDTTYIDNCEFNANLTRITFGLDPSALVAGKTCKLYLVREGFKPFEVGADIKFSVPTWQEGWIPDDGLRATLARHSETSKFFNPYGMIDPAAAAAYKGEGPNLPNGFPGSLNLYGTQAKDLTGVGLFKSVPGLVILWDAANLETADFSGMDNASDIRLDRATKMTKLVLPPKAAMLSIIGCTALKELDASKSPLLSSIAFVGDDATSPLNAKFTFMDLRKDMRGKQGPNYQIYGGGCCFPFEDNATIKIDSWFLWDHNTAKLETDKPETWAAIYKAWRDQNLKIEVYSWNPEFPEKLATVPMHSEDPDALSPDNKDGQGGSANKFKVVDPADTK